MNKALIVPDKKKILLRDTHPTRITTVIPTSKIIQYKGVDLVVVPHELDEVRVLNNMGYSIASPVSHYYKWSGRYTPFVAQGVTTDKLTLNERMFVLNQIGTGKTVSVLWAYDYLRSIGAVRRMLVVTPLSTMERVWADEVFEHFPHLETQVLYGTAKRRVDQLSYPADIYIINHDGVKVPEIREALLKRDDIDIVTVDELASFRNAGTDRWKALKRITETRKYLWGLTGTPIPNSPTDAWAQCRLIAPHRVPPYFGRFREMVERKISQFKWVARDNALQTVMEAMQPSVLFRRDECVDLPPTMYEHRFVEMSAEQKRAYKQMLTSLVAEAAAGQIMAVNEAVKAAKLAQIACISHDTPVLCQRGWVGIQDVREDDIVWDGEEWVACGGAVLKGVAPVVFCGGVYMTPDHEVLSKSGWVTAEEMCDGESSKRLSWEKVRIPDSHKTGWYYRWKKSVRDMGVCVRLWQRGHEKEPIPSVNATAASEELRVPPRERNTQDDRHAIVRGMVWYASKVRKSWRQRLQKLWWSRYLGLRGVVEVVQSVLVGYALRIFTWTDFRPSRQLEGVFEGQLPMGDADAAEQQQAVEYFMANPGWLNDYISGGKTLWHTDRYSASTIRSVWVASGKSVTNTSKETAVYDIVNCGPRNRFVVRGSSGELRIVHNCGVAYDQKGECVQFECQGRLDVLKEIIEASDGKVIVFVPLTGGLEMVAAEVGKEWQTAIIHGGVGKSERDQIFGEFQRPGGLHVLVAHPRCMSHGLTLVEANTIVWFIPTNNHEDYEQANGRITRPGQTRTTLIFHIEGSEVERRMYKRLQTKSSMQNLLLDMIKEGME